MIITVGHTKGGVGKSAMAFQLATGLMLAGKTVWLVDADTQMTSLTASTARADAGREVIPTASYSDGATLRAQVAKQAPAYDVVVIDVGGRDTTGLRAALMICDVLLVPLAPRVVEAWAMRQLDQVVGDALSMRDFGVYAFLNQADPAGSDNDDALEAARNYPIFQRLPDGAQVLPERVGRRKAFANAIGSGLHISEYKPRDGDACNEMAALQNAVLNIIKL